MAADACSDSGRRRRRDPEPPEQRRARPPASGRTGSRCAGCGATRSRSRSARSSSLIVHRCACWRRSTRKHIAHTEPERQPRHRRRSRSAASSRTSSRRRASRSGRRGTAASSSAPTTNGRDVAVRLLYGGRNSLEIGVIATLITMMLATIARHVAGYFRGFTDGVHQPRPRPDLGLSRSCCSAIALGIVARASAASTSGCSSCRATRCWCPR